LGRRKQTSISQEFNQHNKRKSKSILFLVPITHQLLETKETVLSWAVHFVLILNSSFRLFSRRCHNDAQKAEQIMNTKEAKSSQSEKPSTFTDADDDLKMKEEAARQSKYKRDSHFEAGVVKENIPQHIAVIMDGNRRYGRAKYGMASKGHWDGSSKLCDFAKWCQCEGIRALTVYAFSTENWRRDPTEIDQLMDIITTYCDEIRVEAIERSMQVKVLTTDESPIPERVRKGIKRLEDGTAHCREFRLNICLSYGSRGEIINACQSIVNKSVLDGKPQLITEDLFTNHLLTMSDQNDGPVFPSDPDVLIRTSGEMRISNFLLWQLAYTEFFFLPCQWPEVEKKDLIQVIRKYASARQRRFGK